TKRSQGAEEGAPALQEEPTTGPRAAASATAGRPQQAAPATASAVGGGGAPARVRVPGVPRPGPGAWDVRGARPALQGHRLRDQGWVEPRGRLGPQDNGRHMIPLRPRPLERIDVARAVGEDPIPMSVTMVEADLPDAEDRWVRALKLLLDAGAPPAA